MYLGERLGVEVDRVTKCHPELAGEGIGYSWGHATGIYKPAQLSKKKAKITSDILLLTVYPQMKEKEKEA